MTALYPLTFDSIFQERIWGGFNMARLYGKKLPGNLPIGESWEIADREDAVSVITNGAMAGKSLHWLVEEHRSELLGTAPSANGRFPLLIKIIDAEQKLSLQVHPPEHLAAELGGFAKTEMWYIAEARAGAELFVGLRRGTTRADFEAKLRNGTVTECIHRIPVSTGRAMLLPSGRVHAIGGSVVIFEIQQNSDTTYRLFDWNRTDSAGHHRKLLVQEALRCIDFNDFEPGLLDGCDTPDGAALLVNNRFFRIELGTVCGQRAISTSGTFVIFGCVSGDLTVNSGKNQVAIGPGGFCLVPAAISRVLLEGGSGARYICIRPGQSKGEGLS